jgi:HEAT repeat protein
MHSLRYRACLCACLAYLPLALGAQRPFDVTWSNGRLTVRAANAPLADVVGEVTRVTGIEVIGREKLVGRLSIDFKDLAPKDAFARLLVGVNYIVTVQERTAAGNATSGQLVVRIHSMEGYSLPAEAFRGSIIVPSLDRLMAAEAAEVAEERQEEAEDDPDVLEERREDKLEAERLAAQGAFGLKAPIDSIVAFLQNYNDEIRLQALKALGTRPIELVLDPIAGLLGDETWEVRTAAVEVLAGASDEVSLHKVGEVLETSDDRDARIDALRVLALRGDVASSVHLRAVLDDSDGLIRDAAAHVLAELDRRAQAKEGNGRR